MSIQRRDALALGLWGGLVLAAFASGTALLNAGTVLGVHAPPLFGHWNLRVGPGALLPMGFAAAVVALSPRLARDLPFRALAVAAVAAAGVWAVALAVSTGSGGITDPVLNPNEYLASLPFVHSPGDFLGHFTERIDAYSTHVRSHPPGMILVLFGLDRAGLGGAVPAAALAIAVGASASAAALIALRAVAGEQRARAAAPFLVLAPGAVWIATSADAFYMGISAWAIALLVLALTTAGRRSDALALAGGVAFGLSCFLSFGLVLLATIPIAVAVAMRRGRPLAIAAVGVAGVVGAFAIAGYWWLDGYNAARAQYAASIARVRPYGFFLFSNLAAFALAAGPALAVALARLRDRRVWILVGAALLTVALADLSGKSKAEVERIWLPFLPWILLATAAIAPGRTAQRLLAAQAALAIAIQAGVATGW